VILEAVVAPLNGRHEQVWLSMRHGLLFLAPKPTNWAPYAFLHLRSVLGEVDRSSVTVSLQMRPGTVNLNGLNGSHARQRHPQLQLVFLLPDGRWQVLDMPQLEVQLMDREQLEQWRRELEVQCKLANAESPLRETVGQIAETVDSSQGVEV